MLQSGRRRRGNPQHLQPHLLLTGDKLVMEELMPGFTAQVGWALPFSEPLQRAPLCAVETCPRPAISQQPPSLEA